MYNPKELNVNILSVHAKCLGHNLLRSTFTYRNRFYLVTLTRVAVYAEKDWHGRRHEQVKAWSMYDKVKKQTQTEVKNAYVKLGIYIFKREPPTTNATWHVASHDCYTIAVCCKSQSKGP